MAGEDPGIGVITLLLDVAQRAAGAVIGFFKGIASAIVDIAKMMVFMSWRRQAQHQGPKLAHGKQSLKKLRLHEERGAQIVSVEIGDRATMKALDKELKALKIDYAITKDHSGEYVLHYKSINEKDVILAQARALEQLYGDPSKTNDELDKLDDPDSRDERQNDEREQQDERRDDPDQDQNQNDRQDEEQSHDEQIDQNDQSQDEQERQNEQEREREAQEQQDRQEREAQDRGQQDVPTPIPVPENSRKEREANEPAPSQEAPDQQTHRGKHARQEVPALAERMPPTPSQPQRASQTQAQAKDAPQFEPLESLIAKARERAAAKNAARTHAIDRTKDRVRAREVNFSH